MTTKVVGNNNSEQTSTFLNDFVQSAGLETQYNPDDLCGFSLLKGLFMV